MKRRFASIAIVFLFFQLGLRTAFARESLLGRSLDDAEELRYDWKSLLREMEIKNSGNHKINVVLSSSGCSTCRRVLGVLMNESRHSFLTVGTGVAEKFAPENESSFNPEVGYYKFVLILTKRLDEFSAHFVRLREKFSWNPRARHLIFAVEKPDRSQMERVFAEFWKRQVLNAALIVRNSDEAFTYNPYLRKPRETVEKVGWSRMFYKKLRNMNGHPIRVKFVPYSYDDHAVWVPETGTHRMLGSNFEFSEAFFYSVNATSRYVNLESDGITVYANYSWRMMRWLDRTFDTFELWLNVVPNSLGFPIRTELGYPVGRDDLCILVRKSGIKTPSIFGIYDNVTWICTAAGLLTFALYSHVFYKLRNINDNALLRTFGIFLGKNLAPRHHGLLEKSLFLVLTVWSLLILSAYQGALYTALATETYYPEIDTLRDLYAKVKTVRTYKNVATFFRTSAESGVKVIPFTNFVEEMRIHRDEAFAFPCIIAHFVVKWKVLSENGQPLYHVVADYALPGLLGQTFPYGSPYLEKLDEVIRACQEAGLQDYWDNEAHFYALLKEIVIPNITERSPKKLSMNTQLTAFYILIAGLLISTVCYALEIYYHENVEKKKKRTES